MDTAPLSSPSPRRSGKGTVLFVTIIIALVVVGIGWFVTRISLDEPVRVVLGSPAEKVYLFDGSLKKADAAVDDYVQVNDERYALKEVEGASDLFRLGPPEEQLTTDGAPKAALAVSPDGAWIAYAALTELDPEKKEALSSWSIYVRSRDSGESMLLGSGYAPHFFVRDGKTQLFFSTAKGVAIADPATASYSVYTLPVEDTIRTVAAISSDGMLVATKELSDSLYTVYALDTLTPELTTHPVFTANILLSSVVFSGNRLVGLGSATDGAPALHVYSADGSSSRAAALPRTTTLSQYYLLP